MSQLQSLKKRGLPLSLSRYTDVAHWYMPWLKDMLLNKRVIPALDPQRLTLQFWSAAPEDIHSLFFWTKFPVHLTEAVQTWLEPYRVFTAMTITGWEEVEARVPPLEEQLDAFKRHVEVVGVEKVRWRYSPVPNDFHTNMEQQRRFERICIEMSAMGIQELDLSLLQPSPHWKEGYAAEGADEAQARLEVFSMLIAIAKVHGVRVGACADDVRVMQGLNPQNQEHCFSTRCLNRDTLDQVFGLNTEEILEHGCPCQMSVDPCQGQQFGCASQCAYCYVPFTKLPDKQK